VDLYCFSKRNFITSRCFLFVLCSAYVTMPSDVFTINLFISGKEVFYFIDLTQTHCISMKKMDAWGETKQLPVLVF